MLKQETLCPGCYNSFEEKGKPVLDIAKNLLKLYSIAHHPVVITVWKGSEEVIRFLETHGYIVSQEFPGIDCVLLVQPKITIYETENERKFCFKACFYK
jgi:hypothetical protein